MSYIPHYIEPDKRNHFSTLIQGLQLCQIELEMQNTELIDSYQNIKKSRDHFQSLYDNAPIGYACLDHEGRIIRANQTLAELFGQNYHDVINAYLVNFIDVRDQGKLTARYKAFFKHPAKKEISLKIKGRQKYISMTAREYSLAEDGHQDRLLLLAIVDISKLRQNEKQLTLAKKVFHNIQEGIIVTDHKCRIAMVNQGFTELTGYSDKDVIGQTPAILKSDRQEDSFYQKMWDQLKKTGTWHGEVWNRKKNGQLYVQWMSIYAVFSEHEDVENYIGIFNDITEKKLTEERILQLAHFDSLTGLPNRALFYDRLDHALSGAKRNNTRVALLFLDLDNFKQVNDSQGHQAGDELLCQVAKRLSDSVRASDSVARLGGDEFVLLLEGMKNSSDAEKEAQLVADKVLKILAHPFRIRNEIFSISTSIGIATSPEHGDSADDLLKHADMAMYLAKEKGRDCHRFFNRNLLKRQQAKEELKQELNSAAVNDDFALHYQPRLALTNQQVVGCEALIRWQHPQKGLQLPKHFIGLAEESGRIRQLGEWALAEACRQLALWHRNGASHLSVSVNLAAQQLHDNQLPKFIARQLDLHRLPPAALELEITETAMLHDREQIKFILDQIADMGVTISLDDFGSGYSSLSHIKNFPVKVIKIDQSFIRGVTSSPNDQSIIHACVALAKPLGMKTVAEGVETEEQINLLKNMGCDYIQGYYVAKPLPAKDMSQFLDISLVES
ncbi:MAG: EAL domain-containing protein [Desulfuromonadales bacterium]|nr:EAL domain-containing protein [Desulfuromonadales bacterium]MBN2793343.1 EAL domain-containing protein [Desulfuromonadales bacterium]